MEGRRSEVIEASGAGRRIRIQPHGSTRQRRGLQAQVALLSLVLAPIAMATHEVLHLMVYYAFGYRAVMQVTPWKLQAAGLQILGLHVAALGDPPAAVHVADNFLGPALAALLLLVLWRAARPSALAEALLANLLIQGFFSSIETAFAVLERSAHLDADVLLLPELNYGVCIAIITAVAVLAPRRRWSPA